MKYITVLSLISRIIFLGLIFALVKTPNQFLWVPIINGIGAIISGVLALYIVFVNHKIKLVLTGLKNQIKFARDSATFFISEVSIKIFASSNKIIIGSVMGMSEVAYYDLAEKIVSVFKNVPLAIVRDTIFPKVAKTKNIRIVRGATIGMGIYSLFAIAFIGIFARQLVSFFDANEMLPSIPVLRLFSISIFTTHISNYYITVGLWAWGYERVYRNLMIFSSLLYLILYLLFWITGILTLNSIVLIPVIIDIYLIFHTFYICKQKNIL